MPRDAEPNPEPRQPESALLGESVQLPGEDTLEGDPGSDPLESGYIPPDRPFSLDRPGTTAEEQRAGDSLDRLLDREEPDVTDAAEAADDELGGVAEDVAEPRSGRLVASDEGVYRDTEEDLVGHDVGIDGGAASAEEAAMHEFDDADAPHQDELPGGPP